MIKEHSKLSYSQTSNLTTLVFFRYLFLSYPYLSRSTVLTINFVNIQNASDKYH